MKTLPSHVLGLLCLLLVACQKPEQGHEAPPSPDRNVIEWDASKGDEPVNLNVGQILRLHLEGNPTTGYDWIPREPVPPSIGLEKKPSKPNSESDGMVGRGGTQVFEIKALSPDSLELHLYYQRPWEEKPPEETVSLKIEIAN